MSSEYLLNSEGNLEISKIYSATSNNPKESVYIVCQHPSVAGMNDLLLLKQTELRSRANNLNIEAD